MNFNEAPHIITWELTRACQLHCRHCRARAIPRRDFRELTLPQIENVLDDIASMRPKPMIIFTGGDPLERDDLSDIIKAAVSRKIRTAIAPSVTPSLTPQIIKIWKTLGVQAVSISLDGATQAVHDRFRGVLGTFARSVEIAEAVVNQGMDLQINTSVSPFTLQDLPKMGRLVQILKAKSWEVFFVIPTGRARLSESLDAKHIESSLEWLRDYAKDVSFRVTAVGAPQFSRVMARPLDQSPTIREAQGFAFISHYGDVFPSGYLPVSAGNVKRQRFSEIYRESPLFCDLRNPDKLEGRCGQCAYRAICGGSRARAYAVTGNYLAEDPGCPGTELAQSMQTV
ncbi:MAG: radical SAM protein [Sulfobacillus thermosulfidooxidans]|uniref:Radical SAM protein n=1 Tax=Sulfobacillus thermosulfidooxidans TaxID=28034 RepID=A0A2T2WXW4_SULTH|nr:MAG: radical SAM protein [Sulfobacillus thermosulfidooxidans]